MLWELLCLAFALWIVLERWRRRKILALTATLPSVQGIALPLVGHTLQLLGSDEDRMNTLMKIARDAIKAGGIANFWFGRKSLVVCSDAACAELVLKYCLDKNDQMNFVRDFTGNGMIFADVHIWRPRRKVMAPVFSPKTLNNFSQIFKRQSRILVNQLEKASGGEDFSVWKYLTTFTMDAVCETNLGVQVSAQLNSDHMFLEAFDRVAKLMASRVTQPWLQLEMVYRWTKDFVIMSIAKQQIYSFIEDIIKSKRKEIDEKKHNNISEIENKSSFKTFLEMLIENSGGSRGYTDLELREETLVIAAAGTDTSAVGACFTLCMIAKFPEVQEKIYQEIIEVLGDGDHHLTYDDMPRLKYLDTVVKESLRMYPPVPIIVRRVETNLDLPTGHTLVPGVGVLINIYGIHRNPRYWGADADQFRPERFLEPLSHPAAFVPFSNGPRNCIGYQYAMMSIKAAVSSIVKKYELLPPASSATYQSEDLDKDSRPKNMFRLKFDVMMKDSDGFQLRLKKRLNK